MSAADAFKRIVAALESAGITYMVTGSFASTYYGIPRTTQDIDIVIDATGNQLQTFLNHLPEENYYKDDIAAFDALARRSLFNVIDLASGWKIDLIILKSRAFSEEELKRRTRADFGEIVLFVATPEDLIISKLEWAKLGQSTRHIDDVAVLLRLRGDLLDDAYLTKWVADLNLINQWKAAQAKARI